MEMVKGIGTCIVCVWVLFGLIANVAAICDDDLMPLVTNAQLSTNWNVGTIPHLFLNAEHMRGVSALRDIKISGLDTVSASLKFCPVTSTIHGSVTAGRIHVMGFYEGNVDYVSQGRQLFAHGAGVVNMTVANFRLTNLVAALVYSTRLKKFQIDIVQYDATEDITNPQLTGLEVEGAVVQHIASDDEFVEIDKSNFCPTVAEFVTAIINSKVKSVLAVVTETLQSSLFD